MLGLKSGLDIVHLLENPVVEIGGEDGQVFDLLEVSNLVGSNDSGAQKWSSPRKD